MWQCGQRLTETLILWFNQCKKTPNIGNTEMNVNTDRQSVFDNIHVTQNITYVLISLKN